MSPPPTPLRAKNKSMSTYIGAEDVDLPWGATVLSLLAAQLGPQGRAHRCELGGQLIRGRQRLYVSGAVEDIPVSSVPTDVIHGAIAGLVMQCLPRVPTRPAVDRTNNK